MGSLWDAAMFCFLTLIGTHGLFSSNSSMCTFRIYTFFCMCIIFHDFKKFWKHIAELKSRLREKGGLIKEKMRINL